ncbi:MAG: diacylglycerol kinase family lipid kinase [Ruminococcaceae bacterium]|nr:diacylglycerol kinase family lipid kinase [Oscillospiraceae bacterium]
MKHIYLINPAAGRSDSTDVLSEQIRAAYEDGEHEAVLYRTAGVGDATRYVREYCTEHPDEEVRFYACGGDGTFNEVAAGAQGFAHAAVGLIPVGTGNDFMRNFVGGEQFMNVSAQKEGEVMELDLIRCNEYYGVNLLNTGFDCEVVVKTSEIKRSRLVPKGMAYGMGVAIELIRKPGVTVELSVDGSEPVKKELLLCAVGNGARYGGGFTPLPFASLRDGLLDVCIVKNVSRLTFVKLVGSYKKGEHVIPRNAKILEYLKCRKIHMKFPQPQNVCMDGEVRQMEECDIEVIPAGLRFVLPVGCAPIVRPEYREDWSEREILVGAGK